MPQCGRVIPPHGFCERCFVKVDEGVEVGPQGNIEALTSPWKNGQAVPDPPFAVAYVRLNGADTAMLNYVTWIFQI